MGIVDNAPEICEQEITVNAERVKDCKVSQSVGLVAKVLKVKPVNQVRASFGKIVDCRNIIVGDKTGTLRVTLWNEDVNKVKEGSSYKLCGGIVKVFDREKYVSMSSKCCIEEVEDIGEVCEILGCGSLYHRVGRLYK